MKIFRFVAAAVLLMVISCDWPFNEKVSEENIFELNIAHDITRVMPTAQILLSWSEITVESFSSFRIERRTVSDTAWTSVAELSNALLTSYLDTIDNDDDLIYRVGIVDTEDKIIWADGSTNIPRTTHIIIPEEFSTIQPAFKSDLIDDGDSILVNPGYYAETLFIADKDVLIKSTEGFQETRLTRSVIPDSIDQQRVVNILSGVLEGFTVEYGKPMHGNGGGISMAGDAVVKNCLIHNNHADSNENAGGGGVYISDDAKLYNSIVSNNTTYLDFANGIYAVSATGEIINNTIVNNEMTIKGNCSGLVVRNNIFYNSSPDIEFFTENSKSGVTVDYSILDVDIDFGSNNLITDPGFEDNWRYVLSPNSPAVDSGHPDEKYNDIDGTRNDIGAYGGPYNEK